MEITQSTLLILGILLAWRLRQWIVGSILLAVAPRIQNDQGEAIQGPSWKWVDGQCLDKFLRGREASRAWRQYGAVYRIWSGFTAEIVITQPEDVKAFHRDSAKHGKSPSSNGGWMFHQLLGDCMGLINGERWKRIRVQFDPYFVHRATTAYSARLLQNATEYLVTMDCLGGDQTEQGASSIIHAANAFSRFPFMATAEYLYGPLTEEEKEQLWRLGQRSLGLMRHVLAGSVYRFRLYHWKSPAVYRELQQFEQDWGCFNETVYQSRRSQGDSPPIVNLWREVEAGNIPKKEMLQTMSEILFANLDVSTNVIGWLVVFLAENEHVQARLREEIRTSLSLVELCSRKNTLLYYCLLESLRLRPFTTFTIPESSPVAQILGGYKVPANTSVVVDTLAINHNPHFWGENSGCFDPDRFEKLSPSQLRYNLFAFGFGTRKCLGQHFAEAMTKLFVCQLLGRYYLALVPVEHREEYKTSQDTWVPISDVQIHLKPVDAGYRGEI